MESKGFTEKQYRFARDEASALEYAKIRNYDLVKHGRSYNMREHDSMVFTEDGRWFWNSKSLRGGAIEFAMYFEGMSLPDAVRIVYRLCSPDSKDPIAPKFMEPKKEIEKVEFVLPEKAPTNRRLFAYLCKTRALDRLIVSELIRKGDLYEGIRPYSGGEAHNAVFVGRDAAGVPRSAFQRGLTSYQQDRFVFKRDVAGSDPAAPFCMMATKPTNTVIVFEAAIDAISHASFLRAKGEDYEAVHRLALGGTAKGIGLKTFLEAHPEITTIVFSMDADVAGKNAAKKLTAVFKDCYQIKELYPPKRKDWNEYLCAWKKAQPKK